MLRTPKDPRLGSCLQAAVQGVPGPRHPARRLTSDCRRSGVSDHGGVATPWSDPGEPTHGEWCSAGEVTVVGATTVSLCGQSGESPRRWPNADTPTGLVGSQLHSTCQESRLHILASSHSEQPTQAIAYCPRGLPSWSGRPTVGGSSPVRSHRGAGCRWRWWGPTIARRDWRRNTPSITHGEARNG
jgi:hypothetical protein